MTGASFSMSEALNQRLYPPIRLRERLWIRHPPALCVTAPQIPIGSPPGIPWGLVAGRLGELFLDLACATAAARDGDSQRRQWSTNRSTALSPPFAFRCTSVQRRSMQVAEGFQPPALACRGLAKTFNPTALCWKSTRTEDVRWRSYFSSGSPNPQIRSPTVCHPVSDKKSALSAHLSIGERVTRRESSRFAGTFMRPGGFEPPTRGLEVRRSVH
jgi:hypothetical protein